MLALPHRRQDHHLRQPHQPNGPFPSSQPPTFDNDFTHQLSAQHLYDQKLLNDYLESQQPSYSALSQQLPLQQNQYMTGAFDFENPAIRIQQSTPTPQLPSTFAHSQMNATGAGLQNWNSFANHAQDNSQSLQTPKTSTSHRRAASSSSIGSDGSQYQAAGPGTAYSYVAYPENSPSSWTSVDSPCSADEQSRAFSNHLPTPSHTPTQESFMNNNSYNNFPSHTGAGMQPAMSAHFSMKEALMDQNGQEEDVPGIIHSARQSVSSYGHDSPATPRTTQGDEMDDKYKMAPNGEKLLRRVDSWLFDEFLTYDDEADMRQQAAMHKMDRSFQDASLENIYDNSQHLVNQWQTAAQSKQPPNAQLLSPFRSSNPNTLIQRTLQAAQNARSQSPSSSVSRGVSPFRHSSPFRQPSTAGGFSSPRVRVSTAAEAREQTIQADAAHAMKQALPSDEEAQPKTISPKDALLDYHEADDDAKMPLFPESGASEYGTQYNGGSSGEQYTNATQSTFDTTTSGQQYRRDSWANQQFSPSFTSAPSVSQSASFSFVPPAISGNIHLPYSAPSSQYRSVPTAMQPPESTPDFPAHLTSMESSASEAEPPNSQNSTEMLQKPASSAADTGTYTCTYHGCTLRFETPQKLQKHKREGHRNANPPAVGSSMTSAALLERNSQAGPHKCERINPTTGKPCNTIFSRPYDLTRHEDTIHNARKQKVRCALCTEEKTFSRNDALTRHMVRIHHQRPSKP